LAVEADRSREVVDSRLALVGLVALLAYPEEAVGDYFAGEGSSILATSMAETSASVWTIEQWEPS
jgi:hypothetical protein